MKPTAYPDNPKSLEDRTEDAIRTAVEFSTAMPVTNVVRAAKTELPSHQVTELGNAYEGTLLSTVDFLETLRGYEFELEYEAASMQDYDDARLPIPEGLAFTGAIAGYLAADMSEAIIGGVAAGFVAGTILERFYLEPRIRENLHEDAEIRTQKHKAEAVGDWFEQYSGTASKLHEANKSFVENSDQALNILEQYVSRENAPRSDMWSAAEQTLRETYRNMQIMRGFPGVPMNSEVFDTPSAITRYSVREELRRLAEQDPIVKNHGLIEYKNA